MDKVDQEIGMSNPPGFHKNSTENEDILGLVEVFMESGLFRTCPVQEHTAFPAFKSNLLPKLNYREVWQWVRSKVEEFSMVHMMMQKHHVR